MNNIFSQYYIQKLKNIGYKHDEKQYIASQNIDKTYNTWLKNTHKNNSILNKIKNKLFKKENPSNNGIYIWGGVGRGKSFLMDSFYEYLQQNSTAKLKSTRLHFHEFMRDIHWQLQQLKGNANPINIIAANITQKYKIICFDEFHVNDIADAMIFDRLFRQLFNLNFFFIITSNYPPQNLYFDGLQRERFLSAIELIQQQLFVYNLDNGYDYRLRNLQQISAYITPIIHEQTNAILEQNFNKIAQKNDEENTLKIQNRIINMQRRSGSIAWFTFTQLCDGPRSHYDYLELASQFNTIILSDVPYMPPKMATQARRFTWLIDILYDHKVKLIISAQVPAASLYTEGPLVHEFGRTVSRIIEMGSDEYLQQMHKTL